MLLLCFIRYCMLTSFLDLKNVLTDSVANRKGVVVEYPDMFHAVSIFFNKDDIVLQYGLYSNIKESRVNNLSVMSVSYPKSFDSLIVTIFDFIKDINVSNTRRINIELKLNTQSVDRSDKNSILFHDLSQFDSFQTELSGKLYSIGYPGDVTINVIKTDQTYDLFNPFSSSWNYFYSNKPFRLLSFVELEETNGIQRLYFF